MYPVVLKNGLPETHKNQQSKTELVPNLRSRGGGRLIR
jgi:hypothetical protein